MKTTAYIKQSVDIRDLVERYGVEFNNRNQARCPFHDDRNPSASVKNDKFHCWACDLHLDAFDFVQKINGCEFRESREILNSIFGLGLDLKKPVPSSKMRQIESDRRRKAAELAAFRTEYNRKSDEFKELRELVRGVQIRPGFPHAGLYGWAMGQLEYLYEWFEMNRWR